MEGSALRNLLRTCDFGEFPQSVSLSFSGQNLRGYIPATLGYIDIKFARCVHNLSGCRGQFSKSEVIPKFGPQGGSNFQAGLHCGPLGGQIYANIAVMLCPFSRTLNRLKNAQYLEHQPLHNLYKGASNNAIFVERRVFRGTMPRNDAMFRWFSA